MNKSDSNSDLSVASDSSALSLLEAGSSVNIDPDAGTIEEFLKAVKAGIQCWELAGVMLVEMKKEDDGLFKKIIAQSPWMTADILWSFHRIGEGKLYPQVLLLRKCPAESSLLLCDYDTQKRLCNEPVQVLIDIKKDGSPVIDKRWVQEIGKETTKVVFAGSHVRSIDEQKEVLKTLRAVVKTVSLPVATARPQPALPSSALKRIVSLGCYTVQWKAGGVPTLMKINEKPVVAQTVLLKEDDLKQWRGVIEFTKWE